MPTLAAVLATLAGVWLATSLFMSLLFPLYAKRLTAIEPSQRAWVLRAIALTPALLAVLAWLELFVLPGEIVPHHCHLTNCAPHNPELRPALSTVALLMLASFLPVLMLALKTIWSTLTLERRWRSLSTPRAAYRFLDIANPVACIIGLVRPTIYFSRGFVAQLSPPALQVVIAHEQAHATRYDNLWTLLVRAVSVSWLYRRHLIDALELAQEQACDQQATQRVGDALVVAETLLQCQRLAQTPQVACAFLRGQLAARVRVLLEPDYAPLAPLALLRFGSLALLLMAGLVIPLHYVIELL
jgi:Zn-dependent protease with chaperone function